MQHFVTAREFLVNVCLLMEFLETNGIIIIIIYFFHKGQYLYSYSQKYQWILPYCNGNIPSHYMVISLEHFCSILIFFSLPSLSWLPLISLCIQCETNTDLVDRKGKQPGTGTAPFLEESFLIFLDLQNNFYISLKQKEALGSLYVLISIC